MTTHTVRWIAVPAADYGGWNIADSRTGRTVKDSCGSARYYPTNAAALAALARMNAR